MKVKKGDTVLIISGKDKGRSAKIIKSLPKEGKVLVEGINLKARHLRPRKQGEKGQIVKAPSPLDVSNVKFVCQKCGKATRVGYTMVDKKKMRICKKCKSQV